MTLRARASFTLIEMIIAITIFTIFIGFAISSFLTFHRANQDALVDRTLVMGAEAILTELSDAVRENSIDYVRYASEGVSGAELNEDTLYLVSSDGTQHFAYVWDASAATLSLQIWDADGAAITDPILIHSEGLSVDYLLFRIFPGESPYSDLSNDDIQYQPLVTIDLNAGMLGQNGNEMTVTLHTSVTSRFYQ